MKCLPLLIFPCTINKVQKFSSGTGSPGWSRKKDRKTVVVVVVSIRRHSYFFSLCSLPVPGSLSTVPVSHNFLNSLLVQHFVQLYSIKTFLCQALCCIPLQIQTFYQNLVLVAEYHVDC